MTLLKEMPLRLNTMTTPQTTEGLYDLFVERKNMYPLWIFAAPFTGTGCGGKFICVIGAHWPSGLQADDIDSYRKTVEEMESGAWRLERLKADAEVKIDRKVGFGFGKTPAHAFREACYCAGYLSKKV